MAARFPLAESCAVLVEVCTEINCPVTEHEIKHPTPAKVQTVYEAWMTKFLEINIDDCVRVAQEQLDQMDYHEIHQDALYLGVFYHTFCQLLRVAHIFDFTIQDLTAPTYERFYYVLSGLMNFLDFEHEQRQETLGPLMDENAELVEREEKLMQDVQRKREMLEAEREKRRKNLPLLEQYKEQEKQGNMECLKMMSAAEDMRTKNQEMKAELKQLHEASQQLSLEARNREIEINRLKSQVVQSPDRVKASISDMTVTVQRDSDELRALEAKERQMKAKIESLIKYEHELSACIKILDEWDVEAAKLADGTARYRQHQERHEALLAEQLELENQIQLLDRRIQNVREEIARFDEKTERKRSAGKQRKKSLEEQHVQLVERKRQLEMQAAQKNKDAADIEAQIRAIHAATHAELQRGEEAFKKIKDQVEVYSLKVNKALDSINTLNAQPIDLGS